MHLKLPPIFINLRNDPVIWLGVIGFITCSVVALNLADDLKNMVRFEELKNFQANFYFFMILFFHANVCLIWIVITACKYKKANSNEDDSNQEDNSEEV